MRSLRAISRGLIGSLRPLASDSVSEFADSAFFTVKMIFAVRIARGPRSFVRYLWLLLEPRTLAKVSLRGSDYPVFLRPATTDALVAFGTFGKAFHLPPVAIAEDATIIDLGANIGLTSADYAGRFPRATVIAVEMDGANASMAVRNTEPYRDRVTVIHAAAWWEATRLSYTAPVGGEWAFAVSQQGDHEVSTVTVDALVERYGPVDFLKMDIEGAEREVLSKNTSWATAVRSLQVEVHEPYTVGDCERDLQELGFTTERHPTHRASVNATRTPQDLS